jgi:putative transcriptional regulator
MDSLQGQLLIAAPSLLDPNFARTVVLIAVHGEDGALGLILNREINTPLQEVWEQISESPCVRADNVRHGGPVSGTLMVLHDQRVHANLVVTDDLYVATELNAMEALAAAEEVRALFYVGHSGWGAGQLENELSEGSWLVLPATAEHVFGGQDPLTLWRDSMTEVGRRQVHSVIPVKHLPEDPRLN